MAPQPLNWRQRILIQSLLSRGPLNEDDFRSIFSQLLGKNSGSRKQPEQNLLLNEYLGKINSELSYVELELRACRNQYDGRVYYGIVNNVPDQQSKLGTKYKVPQIAFYRAIVEAFIQDADAEGYISYMGALFLSLEKQVPRSIESQSQEGYAQIPPAFKNFSMPQKAKTLLQLEKDRWLCSSPEGKIGLGVRSFLELRSWFRSKEVPACEVCNEAAIKAQPCQNEACNVRIHSYCLKKKFSGKKVEIVCPGCGMHMHNGDLSPNSQPPETSRKRMHNAHGGLSPNSQPLETSRKRMHNAHGGLSPNSQPLETSRKRRRHGSYQEVNDDTEAAGNYSSSPTYAAMSETKRLTRSVARSITDKKMVKFCSL